VHHAKDGAATIGLVAWRGLLLLSTDLSVPDAANVRSACRTIPRPLLASGTHSTAPVSWSCPSAQEWIPAARRALNAAKAVVRSKTKKGLTSREHELQRVE
jgi:hypothetical protein